VTAADVDKAFIRFLFAKDYLQSPGHLPELRRSYVVSDQYVADVCESRTGQPMARIGLIECSSLEVPLPGHGSDVGLCPPAITTFILKIEADGIRDNSR